MKILQFSIRNNNGGVTKYILDNWKYIDKTKFQFDFVTLESKLDFEKTLLDTGANVFHLTCFAEQNEAAFRQQLGEILRRGYDAIHIHTGAWKSTTVEEVAREFHIPRIIIHAHNSGYVMNAKEIERKKLLQKHEMIKNKISYDFATDFWACSERAADWLYGPNIKKESIKILKNGVDVSQFQYNDMMRKQLRERYQMEDCLVLGHVGRFSKEKNHEFLLKILCELVKQNKKVRMVLIGSGKIENEIKAQAEKMGVMPYILFMGTRKDVADLYQMMDIFLLPSAFEGFPIVLVEAQSAGVKCIVSENVTRESNINGKVSYLPLNITEWCESILEYKNSIGDRETAAEIIRQNGYDVRQTARELEKMYSQQHERR